MVAKALAPVMERVHAKQGPATTCPGGGPLTAQRAVLAPHSLEPVTARLDPVSAKISTGGVPVKIVARVPPTAPVIH